MSVAHKSLVFVGIAFGISWIPLYPQWRETMPSLAPLFFLLGPVLSAIICALLFERGRRLEALGLRFRPNLWWLIALLTPLALGLVAAGANIIIAGQDLLIAQNWQHALAKLGDIAQARYLSNPWALLPACILLALVTEEPAWRGYLYYIWRDFGFWRSSFRVGLLWGLWHWPMLLLGVSGEYVGIWELLVFTGITIILATYATLIRDRAGSVIAVALFHGAWNSVSGPGVGGQYVVIALLLVGLAFIAIRQRRHRSTLQHARAPRAAATNLTDPTN